MGRTSLTEVIKRFGMALILMAIVAVVSLLNPRFFSVSNFLIIMRQVAINGTLAAGMTMVIISGGIDLSVGGNVALAGCLAAGVLRATSSAALGLAAGIAVGVLVGLVNGVFISYPKMPPFIVTLATMALCRGLTLVYTGGRPVLVDSAAFDFLGGGFVWGIPFPVLIMGAIYAVVYFLMMYTKFGRMVYAIGGNEQACRLSGINVEKFKTAVYTLSGLLAGVAAVILTARLMSAQPTAGYGYELDAIAAVILGGTSLSGGEGGITGTVVGAFIIGVLANGLNLLNVSPFYQEVAKGLVILAAVLMDKLIHTTASQVRSTPTSAAAGQRQR
ncbi:MAG: ribose ABC transporter permease [Bacillota bacterium]